RRIHAGLGVAGVPGARLRRVPRLLPVRAQGDAPRRIHRAPEPGGTLRAAGDAGRGALRPRDVRRDPQRRPRGRAVILGPTLAVVLMLLGAVAPLLPPTFPDVRGAWRPSDAVLLDRHGEILHERRVDATRRRLEWTPLDA